jgi:peptidoglycan/LPS O-acetylase OafA/YrhL
MKEVFVRRRKGNLDPLDGFRAISIILVIVFHAYFFSQYAFTEFSQFVSFSDSFPWYLHWIKRGDFGVDLFFVLSAFLIGSQLFKENANTGGIQMPRFYAKRLLRIYPVYLFALLLVMLGDGWDYHVLLNLFALNNIVDLKAIVIPWSWSLSVELQFYAFFPLLIAFANTGRRFAVLTGFFIAIPLAWTAWFYLQSDGLRTATVMDVLRTNDTDTMLYYMQYLYVLPTVRMAAYAFGLLAAWLWVFRRDLLTDWLATHVWQTKLLVVATLLGMWFIASVDLYQTFEHMTPWQRVIYKTSMLVGRPLFTLFAAILLMVTVLSSAKNSVTSRLLSHPAWYPIARVSYSMYLFHPVFLFAAFYLLFGDAGLTQLSLWGLAGLAVLGIALSFLFGIVTYYAIERWFIEGRFEQWFPWYKKQRT